MQKRNYLKAEIEILYFDKKDIIKASGLTDPTPPNNGSDIVSGGNPVSNDFLGQ